MYNSSSNGYFVFLILMIGVGLLHYSTYKMDSLLTHKLKWNLFGCRNRNMRIERVFIKKILRTKDIKTRVRYLKILSIYLLGWFFLILAIIFFVQI